MSMRKFATMVGFGGVWAPRHTVHTLYVCAVPSGASVLPSLATKFLYPLVRRTDPGSIVGSFFFRFFVSFFLWKCFT